MKCFTGWHCLTQFRTGSNPRRTRGVAGFAVISILAALGTSEALAQTGCPSSSVQPDPYPDCTYPTPHTLQMFDKLQLGSYAFSVSDELITNSYSGMPFQHVIWDFELYNDQGKFYLVSNAMRSNPTPSNLIAFPWLGQAFQEAPTGGLVNDPRYKPWGGVGTQTQVGDNLVYSTTTANGLEQITDGPDTFEYTTANGDIYLKGTRSGNGTTWHLPWKEPNGATNAFLYNIEGYHVEGTWHGEHVSGHVVNENMWATVSYFAAWWVQNRIGSWSFFSTEYKDGTSESGQFLCGEYGFRGAIVTDRAGNSTVQTTGINTYDKPYGYLIDLGNGEQFKFVDNPGPSSGTPFHFGQVYRTRDKNKVKSSDGVGFTFGRECTPQKLQPDDREDQHGNR